MRSKLGAMGAVLYLLIMCGGVYGLFDNSMSASPFMVAWPWFAHLP
jgi:hypothetical protein